MRSEIVTTKRGFQAKAISGTHLILIALNCPEALREDLKGFSFERDIVGAGSRGPKFLRSQKVFRSIVPDPKNARDPNDPTKPQAFYTDRFPVQSFLWGDYSASPGTTYRFRILPRFGDPAALETNPSDEIRVEVTTEQEWKPGQTHGVEMSTYIDKGRYERCRAYDLRPKDYFPGVENEEPTQQVHRTAEGM